MSETKSTPKSRVLTIGTAQKDAELVEAIRQYQKEHNISCGADAVRDLCKYALKVKQVK